jgi:hypothetical protein
MRCANPIPQKRAEPCVTPVRRYLPQVSPTRVWRLLGYLVKVPGEHREGPERAGGHVAVCGHAVDNSAAYIRS